MACHATGANRDIAYVIETVPGTTPATPRMKTLRTTGDSLKGTIETQTSSELIKGRVTSAPVMGRVSGGGDLSVEMSYRTFDDLLMLLMFAKWQSAATEFPAVSGAGKLVLGSKALDPQSPQTITIEKFFGDAGTAGMYRYYRGASVNTFNLSIPLDGKVTGSFGIMARNSPPGQDTRFAGAFDDLDTPTVTDQFTPFIGSLVATEAPQTLEVTAEADTGDTTIAVRALVSDIPLGTPAQTIVFGANTVTLAAEAHAGDTSITVVALGAGVTITDGTTGTCTYPAVTVGYATQLDIAVNNNMQNDNVLFSKEADCISPGSFGVTGTVAMYLKDKRFINNSVNWSTLSLYFDIQDTNGNAYRFVLGALKFTDVPDGVSGPNAITIAYPFTAFGPDALTIYRLPSAAEFRLRAPSMAFVASTGVLTITENADDAVDFPAAVPLIRYTVDGTEPTATGGTAATATSGVPLTAFGSLTTTTVKVKVFADTGSDPSNLSASTTVTKTYTRTT